MTCPRCRQPALTVHTVAAEATAASVAVYGEPLTVHRCHACDHREVAPSLGSAARSASAESLPVARRRLARGDACRSCGTALTMPARRTVRVVTATPQGSPVTTLRFDVPMTRCPGCGLDQLPSRAGGDVDAALTALLHAAIATVG